MIGIIDYGMGNLRSVQKGLESLGYPAFLSGERDRLERADALVLPGVGAFGQAMDNLRTRHLVDWLKAKVEAGRPLLGICLGLQLLFEESEERFGDEPNLQGLGILAGRVRRFSADLKVPQIGWNELDIVRPDPLFAGIADGSHAYFVHSYFVEPENSDLVAARTEYGESFVSAVQRNHLFGVQFHPEKSSAVGLRILRNFAEIAGEERMADLIEVTSEAARRGEAAGAGARLAGSGARGPQEGAL